VLRAQDGITHEITERLVRILVFRGVLHRARPFTARPIIDPMHCIPVTALVARARGTKLQSKDFHMSDFSISESVDLLKFWRVMRTTLPSHLGDTAETPNHQIPTDITSHESPRHVGFLFNVRVGDCKAEKFSA
jgi:hypothetical protein